MRTVQRSVRSVHPMVRETMRRSSRRSQQLSAMAVPAARTMKQVQGASWCRRTGVARS